MKLKNKKLGIFTIALVLGLLIGIFSNENSLKVNAENVENEIGFTKQGCFKEMEDNWIYYFDILDYKDTSENYYAFDGYNVKYTYLKDYTIKMINAETNEVTQKITSETPILSRSDNFGSEIVEINKYFNKKQFNSIITLSDLSDLNTTYISKDLLVEMFNNALSSSVEDKPGKYISYSHLGKIMVDSTDDELKGKWELTYINDYGYLKYVAINLKLEDGNYLSDTGKYSDLLKKIENIIEKNQSFKNVSITELSKEMSTDLNSLLDKANKNISTE
ncbi:MAG: hypothetical protein PHS24_02650 [Bacilli bacterium]|nr:hypothetical protein [Methanobacteriaceae archaeon]MDD4706096.1 hypothetical protein [Bacilli bacterium]